MNKLTFNKVYENISKEEQVFLSLQYGRCDYTVTWDDSAQRRLISYTVPDKWPVFYVMTIDDNEVVGIFESKEDVNLAFIQYKLKGN